MAKKRKKKQEKKVEKPSIPVIDLTTLDGQLQNQNLSFSSAGSQGFVYYYCVLVNDELASSPWMKLEEGDLILVFPDDYTVISWRVGNETEVSTSVERGRIRPIFLNSTGARAETDLLESLGWD